MKKNLIRNLMIAFGTAACIGLCGCTDKAPRGTIDIDDGGETPEVSPTQADPSPDIIDPDPDIHTQKIDHTSEKALLGFLSGEWRFKDRRTGADKGVLTIAEDGSCEYKKTGLNSVCRGKLGFSKAYRDDSKQGSTIITSGGSSGTNAAAIRGAMSANPAKLRVILPQTIGQQPSDVQDQLIGVHNIIEHPDRAMMTLADASRICNREIIDECQQLICFLSHTSTTLHNATQYAEDMHKVVTSFYLD